MTVKRVEIFAIGNELLHGEVVDHNSDWLCREVAKLGARTMRVVQLPDDKETIVREIRRFLSTDAEVLITTGGLGLSDDEKTSSFVAAALERPYVVNEAALEMVKRRYEELKAQGLVGSDEITEGRRKLAYLPRGAKPLENPLGVAPGVILQSVEGTIISLPGVPEEMRATFDLSLRPQLANIFPKAAYYQHIIQVNVPDEAGHLPAMRHVRERHDVTIKSRTLRRDDGLFFWILVSSTGTDEQEVKGRVLKAVGELKEELSQDEIKFQTGIWPAPKFND